MVNSSNNNRWYAPREPLGADFNLTVTPKITFTSQNSYFLLLHIKFYEKQFLARNDPFEADLHGLEPEKLVLLMRSLNERAIYGAE